MDVLKRLLLVVPLYEQSKQTSKMRKAILITWDNENCKPDDFILVMQDIKRSHHTIYMDIIDMKDINELKQTKGK